jgi:hypothetical protein
MTTAKNMTLHVSRAKCFVHQTGDSGTKKHLLQPAPKPQFAPMWVSETATFKQGIKDGSIVNLTPPHLMPGYKPEEVEVEEEPVVEASTADGQASNDSDDAAEQTEVPQAPFGGQPMTPVQPAVKLGVRSGRSR